MAYLTTFLIVILSSLTFSFSVVAAEYQVEIERSSFFEVSIKLNETPITVAAEGVSEEEFHSALNIERNKLEVCYKHKDRGQRKPSLRQLATVQVSRLEGDGWLPVGRVFAPHAGEFQPGNETCRQISFNAASIADQGRLLKYRQERKQKSLLPNGFLRVNH